MMLKTEVKEDKTIFKQIFEDHWNAFKYGNPQYDIDQYNIPVNKMLNCASAASGYREYTCFNCGHYRQVCFSCKSTFCLSCSLGYVDNVISQVSQSLHAGVTYRHLVLTVPEQLRPLFFKSRHDGKFLSDFMKQGYECLEESVGVLRKQDLKIGCIVVVHTHGRSGTYNPHLHIIMTDGGISLKTEKWVDLGYMEYHVIRRKWQYKLSGWIKSIFGYKVKSLIDKLWKKYTKGFVMHVSKGDVPESGRGLAKYLAKYVASPPISVKRILDYDGQNVKYWYMDHETKSKKVETVPVFTFIGRMVQHIMVKSFQRIRYYGLQATKTFQKWKSIVQEGIRKIGEIVKDTYQIIASKTYRERYKKTSLIDPFICSECGSEMELSKIWHPKYGVIYDLLDESPLVEETKTTLKESIDKIVQNIQFSFPLLV